MTQDQNQAHVIIGAGPSGLTAADALVKRGEKPIVFEADKIVGGISRTETYKGYHFDMGGHRFFSKVPVVNDLWHEWMGEDMQTRSRLSRIFYGGKFFNYPLKPFNAVMGLGMVEAIRIAASYGRWTLFPSRIETTFDQWVTNRFGRRLFNTFFKSYTEKVWGIPTNELSADWAAQRIKSLSLKTAITSTIIKPKTVVTSLIEQFLYPPNGPGQMWRTVADKVKEGGGRVEMQTPVTKLIREDNRITAIEATNEAGETVRQAVKSVIGSMPLKHAILSLEPPAPQPVRRAAESLSYRDFLTVCLIVKRDNLFPDNWIYIHDPSVDVGRIQNFGNWSPDMVPDAGTSSLGLEYFCNEGDDLWSMDDDDLIEKAKDELARIGLAARSDIVDGCVFRVPKSYPVYDGDYQNAVDTLKSYLDGFENFVMIGRNGLHRYNNQDHAMLTGLYAVENLFDGAAHDLWSVNTEQEYHEVANDDAVPEPGRNKGGVEAYNLRKAS